MRTPHSVALPTEQGTGIVTPSATRANAAQ
jgi:hypothetical protein